MPENTPTTMPSSSPIPTAPNPGNMVLERFLTPIALLLGAVIISGAIIFTHGGQLAEQGTTNNQQAAAAAAVNIKNVKTDGEPYVGSASAPVTMALFFDYQCPFCKQFDQTVVTQLYTNYVQAGKLRIVFKDFDFLGPDSITASEFARALWELYPSQFYAWYNGVFAAQGQEQRTADPTYLPHIEKIAAALSGVDVKKVETLMNQKKAQYDAAIQADFSEGQNNGITGTPSAIIGSSLLTGAQSYQAVVTLIDAQLKKK